MAPPLASANRRSPGATWVVPWPLKPAATAEAGTLVISVAGPASGDSGTRFEYSQTAVEASPIGQEEVALVAEQPHWG